MLDLSSKTKRLGRALAGATIGAAACTFVSAPADAHFVLEAPASWMSQDFIGSPQKLGPCGDEGGGTATGTVTAFAEGQTITITVDEKIFHPGHYRISLAVNDPSELPPEPVVTPDANSACGTNGSAPVMSPPVFPVLMDGVFEHSAAFTAPQTVQVTLPPNVTCKHCTLQVLEFMASHPLNNPGGCFYHHCANISISAGMLPDGGGGGSTTTVSSAAASTASATTGAGGASGNGGASGTGASQNEPTAAKGCSCSTPGGNAPALAGLGSLMALAALLRRRRR